MNMRETDTEFAKCTEHLLDVIKWYASVYISLMKLLSL
jgi:hypothetical protein